MLLVILLFLFFDTVVLKNQNVEHIQRDHANQHGAYIGFHAASTATG